MRRPATTSARAATLLLLGAGLAGSATAGSLPTACSGVACGAELVPPRADASPPQEALDAEQITVWPLDLELAGKNDEELFAIGQAAYAGGELDRAAAAFGRVADLHPASRHHATALFDAGLALLRLERWPAARERFDALTRRYEGPDAVEAAFKAAECLYHQGALPEAWRRLEALAARPLAPADRVRALGQRGVVELELGRLEAAEASLRLAVSIWRQAEAAERLDVRDAAQAQFHLGEVYRAHFLAVKLDPSVEGEEKLSRDLEDKASLLLSAQGHYLRTIRMNDPDWAVAAGARIGELYDDLHGALLEAPLPPGLDAEEADAYRLALRQRVRVLVAKAIATYEQTLAAAGRARVEENAFVAKAQASLDRMKQSLRDLPPEPAPAPAP